MPGGQDSGGIAPEVVMWPCQVPAHLRRIWTKFQHPFRAAGSPGRGLVSVGRRLRARHHNLAETLDPVGANSTVREETEERGDVG